MDLLWVPKLQRRLDEEGAPITVMTVHPGTVSTSTRPLHLETQQQHTLTYALHRRADWIQSVVAKSVHYVTCIPPTKGGWTGLFATTSAHERRSAKSTRGRTSSRSGRSSARGSRRCTTARVRTRDTALGATDRVSNEVFTAFVRREPASAAARVQASVDLRPKPTRSIRKSLCRRFSAHVAGHFRSRSSFGFVPERWVECGNRTDLWSLSKLNLLTTQMTSPLSGGRDDTEPRAVAGFFFPICGDSISGAPAWT